MTQKILITGHKGFIGGHLHQWLLESDCYGEWQNERLEIDGIDLKDGNCIGDFKTDKIYDYVIHLAAFAALRDSLEYPDVFWENNVLNSQPIFDYCRENNVRLLYASSARAKDWWQNPYAITKKVNELQAPPNSVGMRFFNVWHEKDSRSDMLYRMLQEDTAKYITTHRRDYIHVHDVVSAIITLMDSSFRGPIDIGSGNPMGVRDIALAMGRDLPIKEDTPGEPETMCAETWPLRELGWRPTINIMDHLEGNITLTGS